jgi:restriction endonuclease S subunit
MSVTVFTIDSSEIEGRLDPYYYLPEFRELEEKLETFKIKNLKQLSTKIFSGITPLTSDKSLYSDIKNGVAFLKSGEFTESGEINFQNLNYISQKTHNEVMKSSKLKKDDLLIAIVGATIGKVGLYLYENEANINQAVCGVRLKKDEINPFFVKTFLLSNLGQKQIERLKRPVARANLNLDEIGQIKIPIPPNQIQNQIVQIMDSAYKLKKERETESKKLLDSIDDYLLQKLGIELPEEKKETAFQVGFSDVVGGRLDPFYYKTYFQQLEENLENGKYPVRKLGSFIKKILYGASVPNKYVEKDGIPLLRIKDINRNQINLEKIVYLDKAVQKDLGNCFVYENEFLISRSGSIGIVAIATEEINGFAFGSFMIKFSILESTEMNKNYLSYFLNNKIIIEILKRERIGAIQGNITIPTIKSLKIPLPPLEIQNEIADHIQSIRDRAKELQLEADEVLKTAKIEVEKIILGEE